MAESLKISAVDIKRLWYADTSLVTGDLTGSMLKTILESATEVTNVHQDTWSIEEAEASQDTYNNQLTGMPYRMGAKTMGSVTYNWTIGQYDYQTKADLLGGTATGASWKRQRGAVTIYKTLIALTEDDQYAVLTKASISAREAQTDGAVGLAIVGTALEPENTAVSPEYWFDKSEVDGEAA